MNYACLVIVLSFAFLHLPAQTPATAPSASPTMVETVAFINASLAKQPDILTTSSSGDVQWTSSTSAGSMRLENGCSLVKTWTVMSSTRNTGSGEISRSTSLFKEALYLDRTDPLSVSVDSDESAGVTTISVKRAVIEVLAIDLPADTIPETLSGTYRVEGVVRSVTGDTLTIVDSSKKLVMLTLRNNAEILQTRPSPSGGTPTATPAAISDIASGDYFLGFQLKPTLSLFITHPKKQQRTKDIPAGMAPESLAGAYNVKGVVRSVSGNLFTLFTDKGEWKSVTLDNSVDVHSFDKNYDLLPAGVTDIIPGDSINAIRNETVPQTYITKNSTQPQNFPAAQFTDRGLAERVAKAYIHAIVLCHKDDKPSPF